MSPAIGPVILDLMGPELRPDERELLQHPLVGGVILFSRHYESPEQIEKLCREIRAARSQPLLISVDQEGGRVQRFREGFTRLPSMGRLGKCFQTSENEALEMAHACGWLMASELLAVGIDLSLAPVLDRFNKVCVPQEWLRLENIFQVMVLSQSTRILKYPLITVILIKLLLKI
jgi:beta-N-acetylhexosaminidase